MNTMDTYSPSIPRLQELSFLGVAAIGAHNGNTFEEIRQALIDHMIGLREANTPSGNNALLQHAKYNPHRYLTNTTEALSELMRLGMIEKSPLPSTSNAASAYTKRSFKMTPIGEHWVEQFKSSQRHVAYDALLVKLWQHHPQFSGYLRLLARTMLVIPTAKWTEISTLVPSANERKVYLSFLAHRAAEEVKSGTTGWQATEEEILVGMKQYIDKRLESAELHKRPNPYPRNQDFVGACEEALVTFAFHRTGLPLDYISHEILRRWTKELGVANFSYHVPATPALRLWITADIDENEGSPQVRRRGKSNWGERILALLPEAYNDVRRKELSNSWVPIYRVRAAVCSKLGLNDSVFDATLRDFLADKSDPNPRFRLNLDSIEFGTTPPTEQPFKIRDANRRNLTYHVMTLIPSSERRD
jgi:hypothetical protein